MNRIPETERLSDNAWETAWKKACSSGIELYDLTASNPTKAGLDYGAMPSESLLLSAFNAAYEPNPQGRLDARSAIAAIFSRTGNVEETANNLFLTASTSEAYSLLFKILCAPGDGIICFAPSYPLLSCLASLEAVVVDTIELKDSAGYYEIDFDDLAASVRCNTRAVVVVSPGNPTGQCMTQDEFERLDRFCAKRDLALIVDEVFADFIVNDKRKCISHFNAEKAESLCFSLNGLSKTCGLPQHKLGWICCGGKKRKEAMEKLIFAGDTLLSVSTWVQYLAPFLLSHRAIYVESVRRRLENNLRRIRDIFRDTPVSPRLFEGGWVATLILPRCIDAENFSIRCAEEGIKIYPAIFFSASEHELVLSLLPSLDTFDKALRTIKCRIENIISSGRFSG